MGPFNLHPEYGTVGQFDVNPAVEGNGLVVLGGLKIFGDIRIKIVFAREPTGFGNRTVQGQPQRDCGFHGRIVDHRQHPGQAQIYFGDIAIGHIAKRIGRRGEHLGGGIEFHVYFKPQHRIKPGHRLIKAQQCGHACAPCRATTGDNAEKATPDACSNRAARAPAARYTVASARAGPCRWIPMGMSSSATPPGMDIAGMPARFAGIVTTSLRYMLNGSESCSPNFIATVGVVGLIMTSTSSQARSSSCSTWVRTRRAES